MTALLAAVEYGGDFTLPPVGELFNFESALPLGINRTVVLTLLATLAAAALFLVAFSNAKVVPGKLQLVAESIVEFIREQIVLQIIGVDGLKFVPLLTTMFMFIWFNNLLEITPFVNFPTTSRMALPFFLALLSWAVFVGLGFRHHGLGYLKDVAFPPGVPWPIYVLLTPIELVSTFVLRPFTLAIRLFANMVAGHILLTIVFLATHAFLALKFPGIIVGVLTLIAGPLAVGFELFIASLQAYIFVILTAVYISGALHPEH
ncbi:MAG: F0F1 ATP synthase subunit A [Actinobacteria bacterium]|nr:F0F1 ATP synthase subunit A [Actinomycetota bacterium]